jgi:hypothetical protein
MAISSRSASVFGNVQTWPHASQRKYQDHEGNEIDSKIRVLKLWQAAHLESVGVMAKGKPNETYAKME